MKGVYNTMIKIFTDDVRIKGLIARAESLNVDAHVVLEKISNFPSVETFQAWKKALINDDTETAYIVERIGGNNYRKIRSMMRG
jgi:hypothetical protein